MNEDEGEQISKARNSCKNFDWKSLNEGKLDRSEYRWGKN
jgi:hypothetical protein